MWAQILKSYGQTKCYSFNQSKFDIYNNMMMKRSELFLPINSANNYMLENKLNWVTLNYYIMNLNRKKLETM